VDKQKSAVGAALVWGASWGFWEATAGHLVHLVKIPNLPGLVMLPAALFFMSRAFLRSGRVEGIFFAGFIAASLKLATILLPGFTSRGAINPALAILIEALAVTGLAAFSPMGSRLRNSIIRRTDSKSIKIEFRRHDPREAE
jgi:hypothetical protein